MSEYDIIAICVGSGGIVTMNRAGEHRSKAAVIEEKILVEPVSTSVVFLKKSCGRGRKSLRLSINLEKTMALRLLILTLTLSTLCRNRESYIDRARSSYDGSFKRNGVDLIEGHAEFVDSHTVSVNGELIRAKHIV